MSPKGRPLKSESPRDQRVHIRLTTEELEKLQKLSSVLGLSYTDVLLMGLEVLYSEKVEK